MLQNINDNLCVSKFSSEGHVMWTCYEPADADSHSKRQMWKRLTGLLSEPEMHRYLESHHPSSETKHNFESITKHSG